MFTSGKAKIPDHTRLIRQLRGLERRTARSGKDSVDHAPRGRDDIANVVCGLIAIMKDKQRRWGHLKAWSHNTTAAEKARAAGFGGRVREDGYITGSGGKFVTKTGEIYTDPRYS